MLDSAAGSILDADSLQERQRRKEAWKAQGGKIRSVQRVPAPPHMLPLPMPTGSNVMEWRFNITLPQPQPARAPAGATGSHARSAGRKVTSHISAYFLLPDAFLCCLDWSVTEELTKV